MHRSLRTFSALKTVPTLTSRSVQSISRPLQKRFREVFGNAWILIFYLSIKAYQEKSLPKSHLGWFFLVFGESKATKVNISIFWFIWLLNHILLFNSKLRSNSVSSFFSCDPFLTYSRYSYYFERRKKKSTSSTKRVKDLYNRHLYHQPRPGVFFAYFRPDLESILYLMCCPAHLKNQEIENLERKRITHVYINSKKDIIPEYDKVFVSVAGAIRPSRESDMDDIFLRWGFIDVVVKFYPWCKIYSPLFQTHYPT